MFNISVIICTHNPRPDYLQRALNALAIQTLPKARWELLLVDNASTNPVAKSFDLTWHSNARHIREDELGLTAARLRGIREAGGELLVFVDDDNVLQSDFLVHTIEIAKDYPYLGAWGGSVTGEFEHEVPNWFKPYLHALAIREVTKDCWSNYYADNRSMPFGAGLCIRKTIAAAYAQTVLDRPMSKQLGRKGTSLVSGEDIDMVLTSYDSGFGSGMFRRLHTTHLIPKSRMTVDYLCRLLEGIEYSSELLGSLRNGGHKSVNDSGLKKWVNTYQIWRLPEPIRSFARAEKRGIQKAKSELATKP
jgi:glycosyltransferase involved in cell wall biosynthesis